MKSLKFSLFVLLTTISFNCFAEKYNVDSPDPKMLPVDTSFIDIVYTYEVTDTILKKTRTTNNVTLVGDDFVKYMSWGAVLVDSAWANVPDSIKIPTSREAANLLNSFRNKFRWHGVYYTILDLKNQNLYYKDFYGATSYFYEEPIPEFNWKISNQEVADTILGYPCKVAECHFRGRHWKAWYAEELPMPYGPWKFCGLPGMILKITDSSGAQKFTAIEIVDNKCEIRKYPEPPLNYFRTTRERHLKDQEHFINNALTMLVQAGLLQPPKDKNGNPVAIQDRRVFHNPIELE